jgi:CheY-like chemotaxis protein
MAADAKLRILLIDGDSAYLAKLFDALSLSYEVCVFNSAQEALDQFDSVTPDLVVLEMALPDLEGVQFVRQLHRREKDRKTPCVFLSNQDSPADVRLGYMVHAVRCFSKKVPVVRFATELAVLVQELKLHPRSKHLTLTDVHSFQQQKARRDLLAKQKAAAPPPAPEKEATPYPPLSRKPTLPTAPPVKRVRVLMADQEPPRMTAMELALKNYADCILCCSGLDALEKATQYLPDVFILGVRLHHMPGFQASQTLRTHPAFRNAPILGTLDPNDPINRTSLKRYGFSSVFVIPDDTEALAFEVARLAYDNAFARHAYPMTFEEVLSHEEFLRLKAEKMKGNLEAEKRLDAFRDFIRNLPKDY